MIHLYHSKLVPKEAYERERQEFEFNQGYEEQYFIISKTITINDDSIIADLLFDNYRKIRKYNSKLYVLNVLLMDASIASEPIKVLECIQCG